MVGYGGSSASSYLADPTSPIPSHCASIVVTSTVRGKSDNILLSVQQGVGLGIRLHRWSGTNIWLTSKEQTLECVVVFVLTLKVLNF